MIKSKMILYSITYMALIYLTLKVVEIEEDDLTNTALYIKE